MTTDIRKAPFPKHLHQSANRAYEALDAFMEEWATFEEQENSSYMRQGDKDVLTAASTCLNTLRANLSMWTRQ